MALRITHDTMTLEIGNGAWIVSTYPARLFTRVQAITALTVAGLMGSGHPRFR